MILFIPDVHVDRAWQCWVGWGGVDTLLSKLEIEWRQKGERVAEVTGNGKEVSGQLKEKKGRKGTRVTLSSPLGCVITRLGTGGTPTTSRPFFPRGPAYWHLANIDFGHSSPHLKAGNCEGNPEHAFANGVLKFCHTCLCRLPSQSHPFKKAKA